MTEEAHGVPSLLDLWVFRAGEVQVLINLEEGAVGNEAEVGVGAHLGIERVNEYNLNIA